MTAASDLALDGRRAVAALWAGLRLVVLDVETTTSDDGHRVVSMAAVTCRNGRVGGSWHTLVNPGVPVTRATTRVHGLTDEHLVGEPPFPAVAPMLVPLLTPVDEERLVVVAHKVSFDVPVLRAELERAGLAMPEAPVLDTMGRLPSIVGVQPADRSLAALLDTLGLANAKPHDALADATATAQAVVALLDRAAHAGLLDFDALLADAADGATTLTVTLSAPGRRSGGGPAPLALPPEHVAGHATLLPARPGKRALAAWRAAVAECVTLRCPYLADRAAQAEAAPAVVLDELHAALDACVTAGDVAGASTVLGALAPLLVHLTPRNTRRLGQRRAAFAWHDRWEPQLTPLGRCTETDPCPACRDGEPCPLDTWPAALAVVALEDPEKMARGFFETTGREAGTGAYTSWRAQGRARLADAAVWLVIEQWRAVGQHVRAEQVAQLAWKAGCTDPRVADAYAGQLAAGGREVDLRAALDVCEKTAAARAGSTDTGWQQLGARRRQLAGRLARLTVRPSGRYDEEGNPIPLRRHHPDEPKRTRPTRFLRRA